MKYFVISDIHGHYDEMFKALSKTDFSLENERHKLIINGDMFDRGKQIKEVLEFLYPLYKKGKTIIIKGNHELFLEDFIAGNEESVEFNCYYNGFDRTLRSLIPDYDNLSFMEARTKFLSLYPYLKEFLESLLYVYETEGYIITHAGLDLSNGDYRLGNFYNAVWIRPEKFFEIDLHKYNIHKKVVVGHRFTCMLRDYFNITPANDNSIYYHYDNQKIGIDGGSYYTKHINVLEITED